jgi:hypothetical protein
MTGTVLLLKNCIVLHHKYTSVEEVKKLMTTMGGQQPLECLDRRGLNNTGRKAIPGLHNTGSKRSSSRFGCNVSGKYSEAVTSSPGVSMQYKQLVRGNFAHTMKYFVTLEHVSSP